MKIPMQGIVLFISLSMIVSMPAVRGQRNYGGTLVAHLVTEPEILNPNYVFRNPYPAYTIYNHLVTYEAVTHEIIPDLAERWEISKDGKMYTFYLAKNVKWHDGQKFTSADVKWTYESVIKEKGFFVTQLSVIDKIETPDDYTVRFVLKETDASFLDTLAHSQGPVVLPKHLYEGTDVTKNELNRKPVATGPFKLQEWVSGSHMTLARNEEYFKGRPYLDKIIIKFSTNWAVVISALESGEIQYSLNNPPYSECIRLKKIPGIDIGVTSQDITIHFDLNLKRKPFDNVKVREALFSAVDIQDINNKVYAGFGVPLEGMFMSSVKWAYNADAKKPSFDPKRAEQLLDEAGYKRGSDGIRFATSITTFMTMMVPDVSEVIKEHLRKIGIEVKVESIEFGLYTDKVLNKRDFDMTVAGGPIGFDPNGFIAFFGTGGYRNCMSYSNPVVDELFRKARASVDREERKKHYFEMQEILAKDLPRMNVIEYTWLYPYRTEFQGFFFQPEYGKTVNMNCLGSVWWTKASPPTTTVATPTSTVKPPEGPSTSTMVAAVAVVVVAAMAGMYWFSKKGKAKT